MPGYPVSVVQVEWHGTSAVTLTFRDGGGQVSERLLYRDDQTALEVETAGPAWAFDADPSLFRLVSEANRIRLAYLFDPFLAVNTSVIDPLPHQIQAVYQEMLPRQPLRFLLADDPGAGKTIMAGLFIKELRLRGDVRRCLVICPGSLVEQWQDEMWSKFGLDFSIITRETIENSKSGNPYAEQDMVIARLDHTARSEEVLSKLEQTEWDLVVVDEAHKMSAHYFGRELKETKRYRLGKLLGRLTRHLLLMTATPHTGREADFQLFMALLDEDRFEGRFRDGTHTVDTEGMMRRLVKEKLLRFDGRPLFPERRAYTVHYSLSDAEARLYAAVTDYVREEMNRADRLAEGDGRRRNIVGFALTTLQRRLASSPEAIYRSIQRRRERLESRLRAEELLKRGHATQIDMTEGIEAIDPEDFEEAPDAEIEELEERIVDQASAAATIGELKAEIAILTHLEELARQVRGSGTDRKWDELSRLLQAVPEMFEGGGQRRKLIVFTEHRDTLNYLQERIRTLIGRSDAVVTIHGGMGREDRRKSQEVFTQDRDVSILVATDAAGEGINLQRAHLMVNYDLPWNPNRIEQRFGRIHRIGQTEVCHMWNLVARDTREGDVFDLLFTKLEQQRESLGGQVFDVLGEGRVFTDEPLRDLLVEAIRYGDRPEVRSRLEQVIEEAIGERLSVLARERALSSDVLTSADIEAIRERMEEAETRRLQPHFIWSFFNQAFTHLGGRIVEREPNRFEVTHVPADIRARDRQIGSGAPVLRRYERVTFHKDLRAIPGRPLAEFVCPGHPLLDATVDIVLERYRGLLKQGAVLVSPDDASVEPRALIYLEHAIQDARSTPAGSRQVASRRMQFVERNAEGSVTDAGYAPYLDYRPPQSEEIALLKSTLDAEWLRRDLEAEATGYAIAELVPKHLAEVRDRTVRRVQRTMAAVRDRLTKEITYWDSRAHELKLQEEAGKQPRMNSERARHRADELQARLRTREAELERERDVSALPPVVVGGAVVVPEGLIRRLLGEARPDDQDRERNERAAVDAVLAAERSLGREPLELARNNPGFDIRSKDPATGEILFIEVKARVSDATTVCVTKTEILTALNKPDTFVLALVTVDHGVAQAPVYVRAPFAGTEDAFFETASVNYQLQPLLLRGVAPC